MSHKVNLVRVLTAATGNSTPITLGARYSTLFKTPAEAGAIDGRPYTYLIVDGNDYEYGRGVYTASGTSLSRNVMESRVAGTIGTSRLNLSGTAQVRFVELAEDMDGVRGTRAVTATTDVLMNSDHGYVVTFSNASAIAASLAQAGAGNAFLDGWTLLVKNKGAGPVTITPATSTIDGAATLVLAQNQGAMIWSDGTNYQSFKFRGDLGTIATKNLSDTFSFSDTTDATSSTSGGSMTVAGGLAVAKKLFVGGQILSSSALFTVGQLTSTQASSAGLDYFSNAGRIVAFGANPSTVASISINPFSSDASLGGATATFNRSGTTSTSAATGAVVVAGGVGITGALNVSGGIAAGGTLAMPNNISAIWKNTSAADAGYINLFTDNNFYFTNTSGNLQFRTGASFVTRMTISDTQVAVSQTTASSSSSTGALTVAGGVGVAGAVNIAGNTTSANFFVPTSGSFYFSAAGTTYMTFNGTNVTLVKNGSVVATW